MRALTTKKIIGLTLAFGLLAAVLLYKQAWRIPVVQDLRDSRLFFALAILAMPLAGVLLGFARCAPWRTVAKALAICVGLSAPVYGLTGSLDRVRSSSRDKAVLCNLRQLAAAADQYFLENNAKIVNYDDLVGPKNYIKALNVVAGEDYRGSFPLRQEGIVSAEFPDGRLMNYNMGYDFPGYKNVYEHGEVVPWRTTGRPTTAVPDTNSETTSKARVVVAPGAPALSAAALAGTRSSAPHAVRRGTMCASCHAKKS